MTVVLALLLGCGAVSASSAPAARVTFWWKPSNASSIAADVAGMRSFSATDVNLYCGYAALADGTFGVDPRPEGGWGDPTLCQEAVSVAAHAGLGVQLVVEGRFDEPHVGAALAAGGAAFGASALDVLSTARLLPAVRGLNLDFEPGRGGSAVAPLPTQVEMDAFTAPLSARLSQPQHGLILTACVSQWTAFSANFSRSLTVGGLDAVYDMGLYHGTSDAEWESKLQDASARAAAGGGGGTGTAAGARGLAVGLAVSGLKYAWENTTASVEARFAAMARAGIRHTALFAWSGGRAGGPAGIAPALLAAWRTQLAQFVK